MDLYVLPRTPPGPDPLEPPISRFGDWREPFAVLDGLDRESFFGVARDLRVDVHIAATVAIEAQLLVETATTLRLGERDAVAELDEAALVEEHVASLDGRRYRRALLGQDDARQRVGLDHILMLPTRLHRRAQTMNLGAALVRKRVEQGVRWELAALTEGRFIEDWGLSKLARAAL